MMSSSGDSRRYQAKFDEILVHDAAAKAPPARWKHKVGGAKLKPHLVAAENLRPGDWFYRPLINPEGDTLRKCSIAANGINRAAKCRKMNAAAYVANTSGDGKPEWRVVVVYAEVPGVVPGDEAEAAAEQERKPKRSAAEKAEERAALDRKLSGRGPVPGFDTGYGGALRAKVIRRGELEESGGD